jgi:hypothetical protein
MNYVIHHMTYDIWCYVISHWQLPFKDRLLARYWVVAAEPWTPDQCDLAYKFLKTIVKAFLTMVLGEGVPPIGTEYLSACRGDKMSFHVIADCLKLDRGYLSCRYLSWELARFSWQYVNNLLFQLDPRSPYRDVVLRLSMLHKQADGSMEWFGMNDTMFDEVIYTRNRQFRLVGNAKLGGVPLTWLREGVMPSEAMTSRLTSVNGRLNVEGHMAYGICLVSCIICHMSHVTHCPCFSLQAHLRTAYICPVHSIVGCCSCRY